MDRVESVFELKEAIKNGRICLIRTDSVPGLTFDPTNPKALERLLEIKGREDSKFISLTPFPTRYWEPLPFPWNRIIEDFSPGPVTFIWKANGIAPKVLVCDDGNIALRNPAPAWVRAPFIIDEDIRILPATSVNKSGEQLVSTWGQALKFAKQNDIYVSKVAPDKQLIDDANRFIKANYGKIIPPGLPSTIVELKEDGDFEMVREGSISYDDLSYKLELYG